MLGAGVGEPATTLPEKQIALINTYAPGGGSDMMFRSIDAISQKITAFPQAFVVETTTDGSGSVGKAAALSAKPDGYTLTVAKDLPDVPTLEENGIGLVLSQLRGIAGPKELPAEVMTVLEDGFKKISDSPEWKTEHLDTYQQQSGFTGSPELTKYMGELYKEKETLFKELGLLKR